MNRQTNYHEVETVNDPSFRTFACGTSEEKHVEYRKIQMHPNIKDISGKPLESQELKSRKL
jgi:hypothetical protein